MCHLEALEAVSVLSLLADAVHSFIDDFGSLSVVTFGPAIASTVLTKDHVVRAEELADRG